MGNNEIVFNPSGITEFKRYVGQYTIDTVRSNGTNNTYYLFRDHIGSTSAITDEQGWLVEKLSYDAFGKRREGNSWNAIQDVYSNSYITNLLTITERGFTNHEHVDHADIIHMGGRIYEPTIGRFA